MTTKTLSAAGGGGPRPRSIQGLSWDHQRFDYISGLTLYPWAWALQAGCTVHTKLSRGRRQNVIVLLCERTRLCGKIVARGRSESIETTTTTRGEADVTQKCDKKAIVISATPTAPKPSLLCKLLFPRFKNSRVQWLKGREKIRGNDSS